MLLDKRDTKSCDVAGPCQFGRLSSCSTNTIISGYRGLVVISLLHPALVGAVQKCAMLATLNKTKKEDGLPLPLLSLNRVPVAREKSTKLRKRVQMFASNFDQK